MCVCWCESACVLDRLSISKPTKLCQQVAHLFHSSHSPSPPLSPSLCRSHFSSLAIFLSAILSFASFWNHNILSVSPSLMHSCLVSPASLLFPSKATSCLRHPLSPLVPVKQPLQRFSTPLSVFLLLSFQRPPSASLFFSCHIRLLLKPRSRTRRHFDSTPFPRHTNHTHAALFPSLQRTLQLLTKLKFYDLHYGEFAFCPQKGSGSAECDGVGQIYVPIT